MIRVSQILLEIQTRMKAFGFWVWFGLVLWVFFLLFQKWSLPFQSEEFKLFICFDPSMLECLFPPTVSWCVFTIREPAVCFCKWHGLLFLHSCDRNTTHGGFPEAPRTESVWAGQGDNLPKQRRLAKVLLFSYSLLYFLVYSLLWPNAWENNLMEERVLLPHRWRRFSPWFTLAQGWGQIVEAGLPPNSHSLPHGYFGDIKHLTKEPVKDTSLSDHTIRPPKGRELNNGTRTRRLLLTPFPWEQKPSQHPWGMSITGSWSQEGLGEADGGVLLFCF